MKRNKHLSLEERSIIERLVQAGKSNKAIAEVLGRATSTIGRELERNCWRLKYREYRSKTADGVAKKRRSHERKSRISEKIWQKIFELYNDDWSPEQISGALKLQSVCVSHETIYRRIYSEIWAGRLGRQSRELFKKASLKPSKITLLQQCCKKIKVLREFEGFFAKNLSSKSQFQSGIWPLGRRYCWTGSWAKLSCDNGRTQYAVFGDGTRRK